MRTLFKWRLRALIVLVLILAGLAIWKRDDISRLLAVNSLFDAAKIVNNFSHMDELFFNTPLVLPNAPSPLNVAPAELPDIADWLEVRAVTGLVVLKDGTLVHESYYLGTADTDLRVSWSVAKSFLSALMGIVLEDGDIASIDDQVTTYAPSLIGSAYEGATIRNVLNMASGVHFDEGYLDFNSDINKMGRVLALGGSMDEFAASITARDRVPGAAWQYVSIDTHVLGMVIRGATGRSIKDLMVEKLLTPLGLEADPIYLTDGHGVAFVLGGLNLRTRDYARMGQLFLQNGMWNGAQLVPAAWVAASTADSAPNTPDRVGYGFQWWLPADGDEGEYFARGVYGQYIYINPAKGVVIALNSADRGFSAAGVNPGNIAMFRQIASKISTE
ncbi:MAG: serine hydrolase [Rhodobacteraceae bacterium]|nr:serine hydrolase [Paracoccaceae bacterium]